MICYKDRTWCPYHTCKNFGPPCDRSLTRDVKREAMKFKLPIAVYCEPPDCFESKDGKKKDEVNDYGN